MNCPSNMEKSSLNQPYIKNRYDPATLRTQYDAGETTVRAFSDFIHWKRVRAEKKICARKPIAYMKKGSCIRQSMSDSATLYLIYLDLIHL